MRDEDILAQIEVEYQQMVKQFSKSSQQQPKALTALRSVESTYTNMLNSRLSTGEYEKSLLM